MSAASSVMPSERTTSPTEVLRDRLLATSWQLLAVLEQLGPGEAQRVLTAWQEADGERAAERLRPLKSWEALPRASYRTYVGGPNHVRIARLLDFLELGDRVLDVGIGYGYVTNALVRTGLLEAYYGIDLAQRYIDSAYEGLRVNELADENVHLEVGSLYDLTAKWVAERDPTLVTVLEVLEHVPDTQRALDVLGSVLPAGCSLIFTVPMLGRLEGVWGHASLFDRARLESMCANSGLSIQYIEPLRNLWTLVMATTTPEVPTRLLSAAAAQPPPIQVPLPHDYTFSNVALNGAPEQYRRPEPRRGHETITVAKTGVRCEIAAPPDAEPPHYGGVALPIGAPGILRLDVRYERPEGIEAVFIDGYAGEERVARWKWTVGGRAMEPDKRIVHVLKPGGGSGFVPVGAVQPGLVEHVELYVQLKPESRDAAFRVARGACAGGWRD